MYKITFITLIYLFFTNISHAYLGPGVGGGIIASTIGIIFAIFAIIFGLIWFPIKRLIKKKKIKKEKKQKKIY